MYQWSDQYQCLCDEMGLPLSLTECHGLIELMQQHCALKPERLAAIHSEVMQRRHPQMVSQFTATVEDMQ